jgi:hypothetical protein
MDKHPTKRFVKVSVLGMYFTGFGSFMAFGVSAIFNAKISYLHHRPQFVGALWQILFAVTF